MEAYALRTAVVASNRVRGDRSWTQFVRTAKVPELPVILLEDCGMTRPPKTVRPSGCGGAAH